MIKYLTTVLMFLTLSNLYYSQEYKYYEYINANNVLMWVSSDGRGAHDPHNDDSGLFWGVDSLGRRLSVVFGDGPVFGFKLRDSIHIQGATYRGGLNPTPFAPVINDSLLTTAKFARDWKNESNPDKKATYELHHKNYPAYLGAPFQDMDEDGFYNPEIDTPEYHGDETLWWKSNSNDSNKTRFLYGSPSANFEIQTTVWAENSRFPDVVYKKYLFINHEPDSMKDFYFGIWVDPDVGYAGDDYIGIDTSLQMMFAYNGDDFDQTENWGYGDRPASLGYLLLDGPLVPAQNGDTARFGKVLKLNMMNQTLHSFYPLNKGSIFYDADLGIYSGALQIYNQMKGLHWDGNPILNPATNEVTTFPLDGDPIAQTGWYEGNGWLYYSYPGDRRMFMSTGAFNLAPGDTNCVTFAICVARDNGRLNSLGKLKQLARDVKHHWLYEVERTFPEPKEVEQDEEEIPESFVISNNYPNPFNNVTNINLELPQSGNIRITIYNALGEVVREVLKHSPTAGYKSIKINGSGLSSGVYYYTVLFRGETKLGKFVLLK